MLYNIAGASHFLSILWIHSIQIINNVLFMRDISLLGFQSFQGCYSYLITYTTLVLDSMQYLIAYKFNMFVVCLVLALYQFGQFVLCVWILFIELSTNALLWIFFTWLLLPIASNSLHNQWKGIFLEAPISKSCRARSLRVRCVMMSFYVDMFWLS